MRLALALGRPRTALSITAFRLLVALLGGRDLLLFAKHLFDAARTVVARLQPSEAGPRSSPMSFAGGYGAAGCASTPTRSAAVGSLGAAALAPPAGGVVSHALSVRRFALDAKDHL